MNSSFPSAFQRKTLWRALTGVAILIIGLLLVGLIWIGGQVLSYLQPVLVPLAVAGIVAYLLDPLVTWFQKKGLSRLKAVITVFASFILVIACMALVILPPIIKQISDSEKRENLGNNVVNILEGIKEQEWVEHLLERVEPENGLDHANHPQLTPLPQNLSATNKTSSNTATTGDPIEATTDTEPSVPFTETRLASMLPDDLGSTALNWIKGGTNKLFGFFGLIVGFAMSPIYLYYFLKESSGIKAHWHDYVPLKASRFKDEVVETLREINGYLISFFRGQVLVALIDGLLVGIALWIFGLPYGLVIGIFMGVIGVIPYIGNIICLIPACIIAYVHFSVFENQYFYDETIYLETIAAGSVYQGHSPWVYVGAILAIFVIVQQINSLITAPKIVGDAVGLHPMTVIFSMLFWSLLLGGLIGALLAVPLTAAVKVLVRRYIWEKKFTDQAQESSQDPPPEEAHA